MIFHIFSHEQTSDVFGRVIANDKWKEKKKKTEKKTWGHRSFKNDICRWHYIEQNLENSFCRITLKKVLLYNSEMIKTVKYITPSNPKVFKLLTISWKWCHYIQCHSTFKWTVTPIYYSLFLKFKLKYYQLANNFFLKMGKNLPVQLKVTIVHTGQLLKLYI